MNGTINLEENGRKEDLGGSFLRFSLVNRKLLVTLHRVSSLHFVVITHISPVKVSFIKLKSMEIFFVPVKVGTNEVPGAFAPRTFIFG